MMATPISVTGTTLEPGAPVVLFPTHIFGGNVDAQLGRQYDIAPDGRFLINTELDNAAAPITPLTTDRNGQHHITIPRHAALRIGTLAAVLAELESQHHLDREALLDLLFG